MNTIADDSLLWQAFKGGNEQAFQQIYSSTFHNLFEYGLRILPDSEMVKDSIHDLFVKIWNNRSNLAEVQKIKPYLLVSLRSLIYNKIEQSNRRPTSSFDGPDNSHFEMAFTVEPEYLTREDKTEQLRLLTMALNQLTPRQKELIYLRYFEELGYEEIAQLLDITVKATYKLMARALTILREYFGSTLFALGLFFLLLKHPAS